MDIKKSGVFFWGFTYLAYVVSAIFWVMDSSIPFSILLILLVMLPLHLYSWLWSKHAYEKEHYFVIVADFIFCIPLNLFNFIPVLIFAPIVIIYISILAICTFSIRRRLKKDFLV